MLLLVSLFLSLIHQRWGFYLWFLFKGIFPDAISASSVPYTIMAGWMLRNLVYAREGEKHISLMVSQYQPCFSYVIYKHV